MSILFLTTIPEGEPYGHEFLDYQSSVDGKQRVGKGSGRLVVLI